MLLGNESGRDDDLLVECHVTPPGGDGKPILRGRWGVGKTSHLIFRNRELSRELGKIDPMMRRIWYRDESGLDSDTVFKLKAYCGDDTSLLKKVLGEIWEAEILRVAIQILSALSIYYGERKGLHWSHVRSSARTEKLVSPIWDLVPAVTAVVSKSRAAVIHDFQRELTDLLGAKAWNSVQLCLLDIKNDRVQPVIVIEPIETPQSPIEEKDPSLSLHLTTALLDLYTRKFLISEEMNQRIRVELSVPWHRGIRKHLKEPQKLFQNEGNFRWGATSLRKFINKRLEFEFKRSGRTFTEKGNSDAFSSVYGTTIEHQASGIDENTFSYLLRHTRHRPRDLQRLCRTILEHQIFNRQSDQPGYGSEDLFRSRVKIPEKIIRAAVRKACEKSAQEQVLEASRRYPELAIVAPHLRGMQVPFTLDKLRERIDGCKLRNGEEISWMDAAKRLWQSGILGVEITPMNYEVRDRIKGQLGSDCLIAYNKGQGGKRKEIYKLYLFEYNCEEHLQQLIDDYDAAPEQDEKEQMLALVFHPMMFEYLRARSSTHHPIGV